MTYCADGEWKLGGNEFEIQEGSGGYKMKKTKTENIPDVEYH